MKQVEKNTKQTGKMRKSIGTLIRSMLQIGFLGFGGGSALIPVIEQSVVKEKGLVTQEELDEDLLVASITPGALPVEIAGGIGKRIAGWCGMLCGSVAMALPGAVLTLLLLMLTSLTTPFVMRQFEYLSIGVCAFILVLLSEYIESTVREAGRDANSEGEKRSGGSPSTWYCIGTILVVFGLSCGENFYRILGMEQEPLFGFSALNIFGMAFFVFFYVGGKPNLSRIMIAVFSCMAYLLSICCFKTQEELEHIVIIVLVLLAGYGFVDDFRKTQWSICDCRFGFKEILSLSIFAGITFFAAFMVTPESIDIIARGASSSVLSFGGGDAYLTVADGLFVQSGILSEEAFFGYLVPIVNVIPGSILCKCMSGIGYLIGVDATGSIAAGCLVALAGFACSVATSCGVFSIVSDIYTGFSHLNSLQMLKQWIRSIVSGLMLTVMLALLYQAVRIGIETGQGYLLFGYMMILYFGGMLLRKKAFGKGKLAVVLAALAIVGSNLL